MKYPTHDDPLGLMDTKEKLRASEMRTLVCVARILRFDGHEDEAIFLERHLQKEGMSQFILASDQVEACMHKVHRKFIKKVSP